MESHHRKRRRTRISCVECHRRKVRCDRNLPCGRCVDGDIRCVYEQDEAVKPAAFSAKKRCMDPIQSNSQSTATVRGHGEHSQPSDQITDQPVRGIMSKARLFGTTHPITAYRLCDEMYPVDFNSAPVASEDATRSALSEAQTVIAEAKAIARTTKRDKTIISPILEEATLSLPDRDTIDTFVKKYMRVVGEGAFRILHVVTFQREYEQFWDDPQSRRPLFIVILLLVMSIGINFRDIEIINESVPPPVYLWVQTAQSWLSTARSKELATISGLQAQCLLILSLQLNKGKSHGIWIAQGTLLRTAIHMGLHRDPSHFPDMPFYHSEMRRRLWSTILEMDLQSSMDIGMIPSSYKFDTLPPSNINDDTFDEATTTPPRQQSISTKTQTSLQIVLRSSFVSRMKVARLMNDSFDEPSYNDVISESKKLADSFAATERSLESLGIRSTFHLNLMTFLTRRFMLALHHPFASKAFRDPQYHFSRKVCLDNALIFLTSKWTEPFDRLLAISTALFQHVMHHATIILCLELIGQIKEDRFDGRLFLIRQEDRQRLLLNIKKILDITAERLRNGETNVKSHVFLHMAIAQVEAMERGTDSTAHVLATATSAARQASKIVRQYSSSRGNTDKNNKNKFELPGSGPAARGISADFPFPLPDIGDTALELGDIASWLFSDWVDEYPL
ncbi:uncharacterized protein N7511_006163 [Penicillium nucicola]|uniref:uncharacterized protein n=1 Tax=Penicillium nucicola TaxID=1850975 RepID=UPI002545B3C8|nr:uncharacterized protein N7511_006163 [Penicillium nucicola]KAJ5757469.1 hypothetical protein N7511_006163 [Penicillium nucicola]